MADQIKQELSVFEDADDEQKLSVLQESTNTPQLSPDIKEVVRKSVLCRRKTRGEPDIKVEFTKPRKYELTEEEKRKKERRTKQNREAARRCRKKKKLSGNTPDTELSKQQAFNAELQNEVTRLRSEVDVLKSSLSQHQSSGVCFLNAHPSQQPELPTQWPCQPPPANNQWSSYPAMNPSPVLTSSTAANQLLTEETSFLDVPDFNQPDQSQYGHVVDPPMTGQRISNRHPLQQEARDSYQPGSDWGNLNNVNRVTPAMPRDDVTSFSSSRGIEQEHTQDYKEPLGIPSLDCIPVAQLLPGNDIDIGQYWQPAGFQPLH